MPDLVTIKCKGTLPGSSRPCGASLFETDGERFYFGELLLELDPPRVQCDRCGFKMRLKSSARKIALPNA
jgi:hypothetical protein